MRQTDEATADDAGSLDETECSYRHSDGEKMTGSNEVQVKVRVGCSNVLKVHTGDVRQCGT